MGGCMPSSYLFDQVPDLKEKFKQFFISRKKMQALDNYSSVAPFQHKDYLYLIKRCMNDGFLGEREADFLCYMLEKYAVNFLDWAHKTNWLKGEMAKLAANYPKEERAPTQKVEQLPLFDYKKLKTANAALVNFEMIARASRQKRAIA